MYGEIHSAHTPSRLEDVLDRLDEWREETTLAQARQLARDGQHAQALALMSNHRYRSAENWLAATLLRAKVLAQQGHFEAAREDFARALQRYPTNPEAAAGMASIDSATRAPLTLYLINRGFKLAIIVLVVATMLALFNGQLRFDQTTALAPVATGLFELRDQLNEATAQLSALDARWAQRQVETQAQTDQRLSELHAIVARGAKDAADITGQIDETRRAIDTATQQHEQVMTALARSHADAITQLKAEWLDLESIRTPMAQASADLAAIRAQAMVQSNAVALRQHVENIERTLSSIEGLLSQLEPTSWPESDGATGTTREQIFERVRQLVTGLRNDVAMLKQSTASAEGGVIKTAP